MKSLGSPDVKSIIRDVAADIKAAELELCQLDGQIGDGDHGTTMSNGFFAVASEIGLNKYDDADLEQLFEVCAKTFLEAVGATVGPLYESAFMQASVYCSSKDQLPISELGSLLAAMASGIRHRGKAELGDKTMLDVWGTVEQEALSQVSSGNTRKELLRLCEIATTASQSTKSMVATKGRAARLGERSLGHFDPGARSAEIIICRMVQGAIEAAGV